MSGGTVVTGSNPKVTVVVFTYNHEPFIAQALESVLAQETSFSFDIVVLEDCSTDATREIVLEFERKWPTRIRALLSPVNKCDNQAFVHVVEHAQSLYIAVLDGDDYWTSTEKLQKQADFLDAHQDCTVCFHNVQIVYEDQSQPTRLGNPPDQKRFSTIEDMLEGCFINGCSPMFRRGVFGKFPEWYDHDVAADWALHILNALHGNIGYLDDVMGVYRKHKGGFWSGLSTVQQRERLIQFYRDMNQRLGFAHDRQIKTLLSRQWYDLALTYEQQGELQSARQCLRHSIDEAPFSTRVHWTGLLEAWRRLYATEGTVRKTSA